MHFDVMVEDGVAAGVEALDLGATRLDRRCLRRPGRSSVLLDPRPRWAVPLS